MDSAFNARMMCDIALADGNRVIASYLIVAGVDEYYTVSNTPIHRVWEWSGSGTNTRLRTRLHRWVKLYIIPTVDCRQNQCYVVYFCARFFSLRNLR